MSDSDDKDSGSGSGSDQDSGSGSDQDSGSNSGSDSGSGSGSDSGSDSGSKSSGSSSSGSSGSDSDKKKKKKKKEKGGGKMNAIDDMAKSKLGVFFELQSIMRSILTDINGIERQTKDLEMRYNPKPFVPPPVQKPPKQRSPSPTRNYYPPGYGSHVNQQVHFDEGMNVKGVLKLQPSQTEPAPNSEYGGTTSHGRASSLQGTARHPSYENLSNYGGVQQYPVVLQQPALPYPAAQTARPLSQPRHPYQIQQVLPANFGTTGPYTKYLKEASNPPEPTNTNRFFQHQPMQMPPMTSRFANRGHSPSVQQAAGTARNYQDLHNQQQVSARPPSGRFQPATTMQEHAIPQAAANMMAAQQQHMGHQSASATNLDSEETARQYQTEGGPHMMGKASDQKAVDRVKLSQIENAIDCLLAQ